MSWGGIVAPAATPTDTVAALSRELIEIGSRTDVQRRFAELGAHLEVSTPSADGRIRAGADRALARGDREDRHRRGMSFKSPTWRRNLDRGTCIPAACRP